MSNTWKELNPNYTYELWDHNDNREFIVNKFPWFLHIYDSYPSNDQYYRENVIKYFYLFQFGGICANINMECLQPFGTYLMTIHH